MRGRPRSRFLREAGSFHEQPDTAEQNEPAHKPTKHLGIDSSDHPVAQPASMDIWKWRFPWPLSISSLSAGNDFHRPVKSRFLPFPNAQHVHPYGRRPGHGNRAGGPRLWMGWALRPLVAQRVPSTLVERIEGWSTSWALRAKHSAIRSGRSMKSKRWFTPRRQARRGSDGKLCSPDAIIAPPLDSKRKHTKS